MYEDCCWCGGFLVTCELLDYKTRSIETLLCQYCTKMGVEFSKEWTCIIPNKDDVLLTKKIRRTVAGLANMLSSEVYSLTPTLYFKLLIFINTVSRIYALPTASQTYDPGSFQETLFRNDMDLLSCEKSNLD